MVIKRDKLIISLKAKESLHGIVIYLKENASPKIAEYVRKGILERCKDLKNLSGYAHEPFLEDLPGEYYSIRKWDYIIIFTVNDKEIRVLNIIHSHRHPLSRQNL